MFGHMLAMPWVLLWNAILDSQFVRIGLLRGPGIHVSYIFHQKT